MPARPNTGAARSLRDLARGRSRRSDRVIPTGFGGVPGGRLYWRPHSSTHPEGWRDWPYETPATSRKGTVPIPSGSNDKPGRCGQAVSQDLRPQTPAEVFSHMPPESLRCKECKTLYPLDARFVCEQCFGPLEVAYASRAADDPDTLKRRIQAGPHSIWRYADFLPVQAPPKGTLPAGWTPLLRADRLAERLGLRECGSRTTRPTRRTRSRIGSCRSRSRGHGSSASRRSRAPRRATWPMPLPPTPRRPGSSPTCSSRPISRSRRSSRPGSTARTWSRSTATTTTSIGSARSSQPSMSGRS